MELLNRISRFLNSDLVYGRDYSREKRRLTILFAFVFIFTGIIQLLFPMVPNNRIFYSWRVWMILIGFFLRWRFYDEAEKRIFCNTRLARGFSNLFTALLPFIAIPWYFFHTRGFARGLWSCVKCLIFYFACDFSVSLIDFYSRRPW